ncbi:hypothetical protein FHX74_001118 [Friedmanniella endophytica]|uniref:PH domain-containing protein n=1 Tax=Microlunatus kandeliicorticis TaxID=1759536 RepID=A0A7W3P525_9ACTN|nr:hypothetical protein [Microlunatus kandeliicorticis]MBA8793513.1 hypothetical protein [Microlunatus kandeliicorticis]
MPSRARRPEPTPQEYAVHIDRRATDRMYAGVVGIWGALLVVGLVGFGLLAAGVISQTAAVGPLVFILVCVPNLVIYGWIWRATRRLDVPLLVRPGGLTCRTPRGELSVPWDRVVDVRVARAFRQDQLTVLVDPSIGPDTPGVSATLSRSSWSTVRKAGLRLSFRVVAEPASEVLAAVATLSGGRFTPALPGEAKPAR